MLDRLNHLGWLQYFGGWNNALQGSASAVLGGIVAAITAWLVVIGSARAQRKRGLEDEARRVALDVARTMVSTFSDIPNSRPLRADIETAGLLVMELRTAAAVLARHDQGTAQAIQDHADELAQRVTAWKDEPALQHNSAAPQRYNQMRAGVDDTHELIINWLGAVKPVAKIESGPS